MTLDPIPDKSELKIEKYSKEAVEQFRVNKSSFDKSDLRHYRQIDVSFDPRTMKELLRKLQISTEVTALVFGGYTGQFANALKNVGMRVIFTDPIEHWVSEARKSGLEAHQCTAQEIPGDLLDSTQLVATFECYPFINRDDVYDTLRFLTRNGGLLFGESKQTRKEMQAESHVSESLISRFLPYYKVYSINRERKEKGDLRLYHFCAPNLESIEMMSADVKVMKAAHDNLPTHSKLMLESLLSIPDISIIGKDSLEQSLSRIMRVHYQSLPSGRRVELWTDGISIRTKWFRCGIEENRLAELDIPD